DVTNQVSAIATDVKAITESLRGAIGGPAGQQRLTDIIDNVRTVTVQLRELVAANRTNVDATMANARAISESLRVEMPRLATAVEGGVIELKNTLGRVGRMQLDLGINSDYYAGLNQTGPAADLFSSSRSAVSLRLNPNPDNNRFYAIELANTPQGRRRDKIVQ